MKFTLPFEDIATGAVADVFKTLAALEIPDSLGNRIRVRSLIVGFAKDTPDDQPIAIVMSRIADRSAGTAGSSTAVTTANIPKKDPDSIDSLVAGERNYTVEPTTFETENIFADEINDRGGIIKEWDEEGAPKFTRDQLCAVRAAPRRALAASVTGTIEFELY